MKILEDKRVTALVVALVIGALVAALWAPIDGETKVELVGVIAAVGVALAGALRGVAPKLIPLGLALALSASLGGCGASALRQHAQAARVTMVTLDAAGVAIVEGTRISLVECARRPEPERAACIDGVEAAAVRAAGARDALIAPAHVYRDGVLAAGDEETPGLVEWLLVIAGPVVRGWPSMADAMGALGVQVPALPIGGE